MLRRHLFDIDVILNRTMVWAGMTASILVIYIGVVTGIGAMFNARNSLLVSLLATGLVAVLFQPLREKLQRGVNRMLFGDRDDPYRALSRLSQRIEATISHHDLLPAIVRATADALRLPYVALHLGVSGSEQRLAFAGTPGEPNLGFPIVYRGEPVGTLQVAPRSPDEPFSAADRRLLVDLARQIGIAAHTVQLTTALQHSREQIVTAREEERRRLRRDLHDGLGAQLAGLSIQVCAAQRLIVSDPVRAQEEMGEVRTELRLAVADIRRLVQGLRPPALDEFGIVQALTERVKTFGEGGIGGDGTGMQTHFEVTPDLPHMPAAVEVAVFRITEEALSNAARHAGARMVTVSLQSDQDGIVLRISDNGRGLPADVSIGLGMHTMRERSEELGGTFAVDSAAGAGVTIRVHLPVDRIAG
jgi:signal transduction histidine kinase